jgi:hypothetical protein
VRGNLISGRISSVIVIHGKTVHSEWCLNWKDPRVTAHSGYLGRGRHDHALVSRDWDASSSNRMRSSERQNSYIETNIAINQGSDFVHMVERLHVLNRLVSDSSPLLFCLPSSAVLGTISPDLLLGFGRFPTTLFFVVVFAACNLHRGHGMPLGNDDILNLMLFSNLGCARTRRIAQHLQNLVPRTICYDHAILEHNQA